MMRCWKDSCGFVFGGLLIDTLVHDYLSSNSSVWDYGFDKSVEILSGVLEYMSNKNKDSIIYALGSYQTINDKGKGAYIEEAKVFFNKIEEAAQNLELETVFISMFGKRFEDSIIESKTKAIKENVYSQFNCRNTEEYIEDKFPVNIKYPLSINCRVTANGWRPILLRKLKWLPIKRNLEFYIESTNTPKPYTVYWKVRNVDVRAYERDCIRGQITKGDEVKRESSDFDGQHYVECYLIKNNICVARNIIVVPINSNYIDNENKLFM